MERRAERARRELRGQAVPRPAARLQRHLHQPVQGAVRRVQRHAAPRRRVGHLRGDGSGAALRPLPRRRAGPQPPSSSCSRRTTTSRTGSSTTAARASSSASAGCSGSPTRVSWPAFGVGGPIVLGAITSPLAEPDATTDRRPRRRRSSGPTTSGPARRSPPARRSGSAFPVARFAYGGFFIRSVSSVEGVSAQALRAVPPLDLLAPLWRQLRLGVSADYFNRSAHYHGCAGRRTRRLPQLRVFLAKVSR